MNFLHAASIGDIIYSLPFIKSQENDINILYIAQTHLKKESTYFSLKDFLEFLPFIDEVRPYQSKTHKVIIDYDLTEFRQHKNFYNTHLIQNYFDCFNRDYKYKYSPFVSKYGYNEHFSTDQTHRYNNYSFVCVNITNNYRTGFNWEELLIKLTNDFDYVFFIGYEHEYNRFNHIEGLEFFKTFNIFEVYKLFSDYRFKALFCNQSSILTLAQSMDLTVYLEQDTKFKTAHIKRENEYLLNE